MASISIGWLLGTEQLQLPDVPLQIPERESFTEEEISEAVEKIVRGAVRRPYGVLGERKTLEAFSDTMDAAAGVFILTPDAPFYVLLLAARRVNDLVVAATNVALELLATIEDTGRRARPLTNITSLGNAQAALFALESASSERSRAFDSIESIPAFQRFDRHTDRFLADASASIRKAGAVVQTPQQARLRIAGLATSITESSEEVRRRVALLAGSIDDFNSMNLPALLAQGVISKARRLLQDRIDQLEVLTPSKRLEVLRETALDVLTSKAVVKGFGSLAKSSEFATISGLGHLYSDANHLAEGAVVESDLLDPYIIIAGQERLSFKVEFNNATLILPLPRSFIPALEGTAREPFQIVAGTNDVLEVVVQGFPDLAVTLTAGAARTAQQIVADINAAIGAQPIIADTFLNPTRFVGTVNVTGTDPAMVFTGTGVDFVVLAVEVGDAVLVQSGLDNQLYFIVTARTSTTIDATRTGPGTAVPETNVTISVGPAGRFVRIRIEDGGEEDALENNRSLRLADDTEDPAYATLGLLAGMQSNPRKTRADEVAAAINTSASSTVRNVPRVTAAAVFVGGDILTGRTEPSDPLKVVSSVFRAFADVIAAGPAPTRFAVAGALSAGVQLGDILTMRSGVVSGDVGERGPVTLVTDTEVQATMSSPLSVGPGVSIEIGRPINPSIDQVVRVLAPSPISGDYRVTDTVSNPTETIIDRGLPLFVGQGGQPLTFQMQVGAFRVDFTSGDQTVNSQLEVSGEAAARFFTTFPRMRVGASSFVLLEKDPKILGAGDILELYSGQYEAPEEVRTIIGFEQGQKLLQLDAPLSNSFLELDFSASIDTSFARIRKASRNNYDVFKAQLGLWLALAVNSTKYFRDLDRLLNPLIVNENPTASAVNSAKIHVQTFIQALQQLQVVLNSYQVDVVPRVDTLIDSFLERGSDRAVDTLLEGRFTDFFGYNSEEVSYLGNSLERLREVSRLDLPIRRSGRKEVIDQELTLAEFEEPDFEFDQSDIQDTDEPDIPVPFVEISGGNF